MGPRRAGVCGDAGYYTTIIARAARSASPCSGN